MYIAFKWLIGLTFAMWLSMCCIDVLVKSKIEIKQSGSNHKMLDIIRNATNSDIRKVDLHRERYFKVTGENPQNVAFFHCFMFLAGALAVSLYNRRNEIILYTKRKFSEINTKAILDRSQELLSNVTAEWTWENVVKYSKIIWIYMNTEVTKLWNKLQVLTERKQVQKPRINIILLKKLQEIGEERKNLGQLLIAAIHENKNIRMQYQLENMAKNRLVRHIENTQKVIKENRSRYVSFQQLYLVTHQENSFLKSRIKKLAKEKEEAEKNLLELMNAVYKSKNSELKAFCSRFIVKTADNLLNSNVCDEIQKFLEKSRSPVPTTSNWQLTERPDNNNSLKGKSSWQDCANPHFAEIIQDDILVPLVSDAPKLKGLPGEYVWTVKDKDGLIEKLYEYDYESDLDDGDTIKRIRQYSVYYDKDCLLDFSNSRTVVNENRSSAPRLNRDPVGVEYPLATQGFLTGSEAFQKFMQNNRNIVSCTPRLPGPPILNG